MTTETKIKLFLKICSVGATMCYTVGRNEQWNESSGITFTTSLIVIIILPPRNSRNLQASDDGTL